MAIKIPKVDEIPVNEQTPLVLSLLESLNALYEENQFLRDEIARLKGEKPKPDIKPSSIGSGDKKANSSTKRPGSDKRKKTNAGNPQPRYLSSNSCFCEQESRCKVLKT